MQCGDKAERGNDTLYDSSDKDRPNLWLQPVPEWRAAKRCWGGAWPFHVYFFAFGFLTLGCVAVSHLVVVFWAERKPGRQRRQGMRQSQSRDILHLPIFTLVSVLAFSRSLSLFVDPYGSADRLPSVVARTLFGLGFTCLLSAYQLLFAALRSALRLEIGTSAWLRRRLVVAGIVVFFLAFNTVVDIVLVEVLASRALLLSCVLANTAWTALMIGEYSLIAYRLHVRTAFAKNLKKKRLEKSAYRKNMEVPETRLPKESTSSINEIIFRSSPEDGVCEDDLGQGDKTAAKSLQQKTKHQLTTIGITSILKKLNQRRRSKSAAVNLRGENKEKVILGLALLTVLAALCYFAFELMTIMLLVKAGNMKDIIQPWVWYANTSAKVTLELILGSAICTIMVIAQRRTRKRAANNMKYSVNESQCPPLSSAQKTVTIGMSLEDSEDQQLENWI